MDSFILDIAKTLNIPDFLFRVIPNFYEQFSNWYFSNFHYWEFIPDDPSKPVKLKRFITKK